MTLRVNGVVAEPAFTASLSPDGTDAKCRTTVWGSIRTLLSSAEPGRVGRGEPQLEVGGVLVVRRVERAGRDARDVLHVCVWQFDGQCCIITDHDSRGPGQSPVLGIGR